jgi:hypothetical protein
LDYFLEISQVCNVLIKLTPKDYVGDITFPPEIITETAVAAADSTVQHNGVNQYYGTKKDGFSRLVQDFRKFNVTSHDDRYSMKTVNKCIGNILRAGSTLFYMLDLTHGFWQMPLEEERGHLTAFSIPGLDQFVWVVGPMDVLGCPASFQHLVELSII